MNVCLEVHNELLTNEMICYLGCALHHQMEAGWEA